MHSDPTVTIMIPAHKPERRDAVAVRQCFLSCEEKLVNRVESLFLFSSGNPQHGTAR